jgi:hypothetical protein
MPLLTPPPRAYHLAEATNWPFIRRDGLLSASRLLSAAGLAAATRDHLLREQRTEHTVLPSGVHIRDQCPMPPAALTSCLHGMSPAEWYAQVNARVFFWFDPDRLNRQRAACAARAQVVLIVDAPSLARAYEARAALTPFNTGNARRKPARRSAATFVPFVQWQHSGWDSEAVALGIPARKRSHPPVELTILDAVPDVERYVMAAVDVPVGKTFQARAH